jgi:hypothetical protein
MKRVILVESEKSNILTKHNLIFETDGNDQEILMNYKKEFMKGSYDEIADKLEKLKEMHSWTQEDIGEINQAIAYLRKNNAFSEVAKNMIDKKLDEYIKSKTEMVKNMMCDTVKTHPDMATEQMKNFCSGKEEKPVEKKNEIKIDIKPEDKKVGTKSTNTGSFMDPYGSGSNTSPGSFMNPYGS